MNLLIIGGSDAGIAAALRARELNATARITLVLADEFPNYNICGLPFYVSGETANWRDGTQDRVSRHRDTAEPYRCHHSAG